MFKKLQNNPNINGIMIVPFSALIDDSKKQYCESVLGDNIPDESNIVFSSSKEDIEVLGYYVLDNLNMVYSKYFETVRSATVAYGTMDPTGIIEKTKCIHIAKWVFDNSLRNTSLLQHIFSTITNSADSDGMFIWCDSNHGNLLFYPIYDNADPFRNTQAILYFSGFFMFE